MNIETTAIKTALISVSNKDGITDFARGLNESGVEILSTGGTARTLREAGIPVTDVSDYTGFPEIMNGRIKTLHPLIAGGILGLRDQHRKDAEQQGIQWIDLVVCNLYPFAETIQKKDTTPDIALENIDIGGPAMIRSAAKNVGWVAVVVDPGDYNSVLKELRSNEGLTYETRKHLSAKAFGHTAQYDAIIHNYLKDEPFSDDFTITFKKYYDLRYGENPHQKAAAFKSTDDESPNILNARIHQGKKLSYNNIMDADAAFSCVREFSDPTCVVVKHANPCGAATDNDLLKAYQQAFNADRMSAFGGIIALNKPCTQSVADEIVKVFMEIVLAPTYSSGALEILSRKKNLRVLEIGNFSGRKTDLEYRYVDGGLLVQETDVNPLTVNHLNVVTETKPSTDNLQDMLFAWKVLKHVKSNGILIAKEQTTVGIGAGQPSRIDAVDIALRKAGNHTNGAILASDAFFPFRDSIDKLAGTGIKAIFQPGGSIRDQEVIDACNEHSLTMVFTGMRCFKH